MSETTYHIVNDYLGDKDDCSSLEEALRQIQCMIEDDPNSTDAIRLFKWEEIEFEIKIGVVLK